MADEFISYRSFNDKAFATELYSKLVEKGIPAQWESSEGIFDPSFVTNEILNQYYIKLHPTDFAKADEIIEQMISNSNETPTPDYYLFSFSNEELLSVLKVPDEWNEFDQFWAKKILEQRGVEIRKEELEAMKNLRIQELKKPWKADITWIILALVMIVLACFLFHVFSAFGLILLGGYIGYSKKIIPNGEKIWAFSSIDRLIGKMILIVGIAVSLFIVLIFFGILDW